VIEELGEGVSGYSNGDRVLVGAITPCGQCRACLSGHSAQCGHGEGYEALGGWRFGNTINGAQAEYLKVPYAQANLAKIPEELTWRSKRSAPNKHLKVRCAACGRRGLYQVWVSIRANFRSLMKHLRLALEIIGSSRRFVPGARNVCAD